MRMVLCAAPKASPYMQHVACSACGILPCTDTVRRASESRGLHEPAPLSYPAARVRFDGGTRLGIVAPIMASSCQLPLWVRYMRSH